MVVPCQTGMEALRWSFMGRHMGRCAALCKSRRA